MSGLSPDKLAEIEALMSAPDVDASAFADFRQRFPGVSFTRCDPTDVDGEKPYKEFTKFNLYLVSAVNHCVTMTRDPAVATGIIIVPNKAAS